MDEEAKEPSTGTASEQALERVRSYASRTSDLLLANAFSVLDKMMSKGDELPEQWSAKASRAGRPVERKEILEGVEHGLSCYAQGCGCTIGRRANTERARRYRMMKKEQSMRSTEKRS